MKFHCYVTAMTRRPAADARMAMSVINAGIAHTIAAIRKFTQLSTARWGVGCETRVSAHHVRLLGLTAFQRVLQRKQVLVVGSSGEAATAVSLRCVHPAFGRAGIRLVSVWTHRGVRQWSLYMHFSPTVDSEP
jgi:hypothetical protein